ncbi:MAG: Lrp/AsnC family transcriptional regulator [Candidatus Heimdallarchaeota archaeon]|nr:Lrp/AsnC family transcriptional regulator [Candidatus Heimdallarchaeota archaeon]MDH5645703.1 Lrp/AsnC family transcriptional regulator [Candidatus Heimdallarchaeota archaeon]
MTLDLLDIQIIDLLRKDARITIKGIADKLERRRATIFNRIIKLEEREIIKGYSVVIDFEKVNYGITAFILIAVMDPGLEKSDDLGTLSKQIGKLPFVTEIHHVTGEWDYLLKVRVKDLETLGKKVIFNLRKLFGIGRTLTLTSLYDEVEELGNEPFRFLQSN